MKITYSDEGAYSRIWLTGPFWQLAMAGALLMPDWTLPGKYTGVSRAHLPDHPVRKERVCAQGI
ncbi:hypothetical protein [Klebsiella pneumoniae]|uniref:hypothetical protein n=1 Tax=Klebsiella pneumoniae TaxID=573 RepID=UPI001D18DA27|nr:hypothetical protein [Klebsiella pneumoniae]